MQIMTKVLKSSLSIILFAVLLSIYDAGAQNHNGSQTGFLTLEECIATALESNYSVAISTNNLEIAKNNVNLEPFLPSLSASSRFSDSRTGQKNYNSTGDVENNKTHSTSVINGLNASWRLFDGFYMFAAREKQEELLKQGQYNFRSVVENLIMTISSQYYKIISLQNQVDLLNELVAISQIRYNQALTRYDIGSDSGLEYKQAKIYLNSDSSSLMLQKENLKNAYIELFELMNLPLDSPARVQDTIIPERQLQLQLLLESALGKNTELNAMRTREYIAGLDYKIAQSSRYPVLDLTAGYNYNFNRSQLIPSKYNESDGFNWGVSLSLPIFSGGELNRRVRNAAITRENERLNLLRYEKELESEIRQLYNFYNNNLRSIDFEEESRESAFLNLEAAIAKYRLGSLSGIEFRDYQLSYLSASDRKLRALYETKLSEIRLRLMAGELFAD